MSTDPQFSVITRKPQILLLVPFREVPTGVDKAKFLISRGRGGAAGGKCSRGREGVVDGHMAEMFEVAGIVLPRCNAYIPGLTSGGSRYVSQQPSLFGSSKCKGQAMK